MIHNRKLDLQLFTEGGASADAGEGGAGSEAEVRIGDVLEDGTVVDANLANSMREDADMYPALKQGALAQGQPAEGESDRQASGGESGDEPTPEEWADAKKRFAKYYGTDVRNAVNDRFKNQKDVSGELEKYKRTTALLMKKAGVDNFDEFSQLVEDDDSIYEQEAEERGMTTEQLKTIKKLEEENSRLNAERQRAEEQQTLQKHVAGVRAQAEELQKLFPNFSLEEEMKNPDFIRLTKPGGISVKQAFFALHGEEMVPQLMAYGVQQGKNQISRSIQANQARPIEGASRRGPVNVKPHINTENMSDEEYEAIKRRTIQEGPQML